MKAPVRQLGWAGVFLLCCLTSAQSPLNALEICKLSDVAVCKDFAPEMKVGCTKHVQLAVAFCRKAARVERFGSHEDHCKAACRAGAAAFKLELGLQDYAITTARNSAAGNQEWLGKARQHWQAMAAPDAICTPKAFDEARTDCQNHCAQTARRRDLEELQGLAAGKDFLDLLQPVFACPPGPAIRAFSEQHNSNVPNLYPPGHQRRTGTAAE